MGRKSRSRKADSAPPPQPTPQPHAAVAAPRTNLAIAGALIVLTLAVYGRVASHQFLDYDDNVYITHNAITRQGLTVEGLKWAATSMDVNFHPVTWLTHMLDVELFGLDAGKHHLVNLGFHIANVLLVFFLLERMTRARWRSAIVAALFAIHPLHVESVAWVAERKDVLSTLFFLVTLWLYVAWTERKSAGLYAAMLVTFILGLLSKQMLVTLPFVLLLLDYWPLGRLDLDDRNGIARRIVEKIPFFAITLAASVIAFVAQRALKAVVSTEKVPIGLRVANAIVTYVTYLRKTFVPYPLALPYPYIVPSPMKIAVCAIVLVIVTALAIVYRSNRPLFTGWFWFVGTLVPVIGLVQIGSQSMADRYTYIPHIGLLSAIVWLAAEFGARMNIERVMAALAAVAIVALAVTASLYVAAWHDSTALFEHDIAVTKQNYVAHSLLGSLLMRESRFDDASTQFRKALAIDPVDANALMELGDLALKHGKRDEAIAFFQRALKAEPSPRAEAKMAVAQGDVPKAIEKYRQSVKEDPYLVENHADLAAVLAMAGKDDEALAENFEALKLDPGHYDANMNVGALLSRMNRNDEALVHFRQAATTNPTSPEPHVYLALLYGSMGRPSQALAEARLASQINHDASNLLLTNALHMEQKSTNLDEFIAYLEKGGR